MLRDSGSSHEHSTCHVRCIIYFAKNIVGTKSPNRLNNQAVRDNIPRLVYTGGISWCISQLNLLSAGSHCNPRTFNPMFSLSENDKDPAARCLWGIACNTRGVLLTHFRRSNPECVSTDIKSN